MSSENETAGSQSDVQTTEQNEAPASQESGATPSPDGGNADLLTGGAAEGAGAETESSPDTEPAPAAKIEDLQEALGDSNEIVSGALQEAADLMSKHKIGKEAAQELVKYQSDLMQRAAEATAQTWQEQISAWQRESREHPEFGGDKLDQSLAQAREALETYGDDKFKELVSSFGFGNHPSMIQFLLRVSQDMPKEGTPVMGSPRPPQKSMADKLFGPNN